MAPLDPIAFPTLNDEEIAILQRFGTEAWFEDRAPLWEIGDTDFCLFVVCEGQIAIRDCPDTPPIVIHEAGGFTGDVDVLTGRPAPIGAYALGKTKTLQISAEDVREIVRVEQNLGGKILLAFIRRRHLLLELPNHGVILIGSSLDPETTKIREFLGRNRVVHQWRDPEDPETGQMLEAFGIEVQAMPFLFLGDIQLVTPTLDEIADKLRLRRTNREETFDLVIIGAGPSGLAAAVYGSSEGLKTLMVDRAAPGGQAAWSSRIENYMGFPEGLTGSDLASRGILQAQKFGAEISIPSEVVDIDSCSAGHLLTLTTGEEIGTRAVILATGAKYQKLPIPGYEEFERSGIYYAATQFEADFCKDSEVVVVGAGNSAGQAAVYLSQSCKKVRLIVRSDRLNKSMSDYLSYRVEKIPNIEIHLETEVAELQGDEKIQAAVLRGQTDDTVPCDGLFVFIGATPNTDFVKDKVSLDRNGFILTGDSMRGYWEESRIPFYLETSCPGIFAAGDCRVGSVKRVASSVGEGSMAVTFVHRVLALN